MGTAVKGAVALVLVTYALLMSNIALAQEEGLSPVSDVVHSPKVTTENATKYISALQDKAYEVADKKGIWLPPEFLDGPHDDDMFLQMLRLLLGNPVDHIQNIIKGRADPNSTTTHITLTTLYAKVMNSIGVLIIGVIALASTLFFFAKRSMDISYLTNQKEEAFPFIFMRSGLGTLISYPIPALGGMSALQGLTITVLLLGLGFATAIIKLSIPYSLAPNMVMQPQPHVAKFVDFVLEAKTCTMAFAKADGKTLDTYKQAENGYKYVDIKRKTYQYGMPDQPAKVVGEQALFGISENGDCGTLETKKVLDTAYIDNRVESTMARLIRSIADDAIKETLQTVWTSELINDIAIKLNSNQEQQIVDEDLPSQYAHFRISMQDQLIGTITQRVRESFDESIDGNQSIYSQYKDSIGNIGFMGLGALHTMMTYQQMNATQQLSDLFAELNQPVWDASNLESKGLIAMFKDWWNSSGIEHVEQTKAGLLLFFKSAHQASPAKDPKDRIDAAVELFTPVNYAQSMGQSIIEIFREDSHGVVFPNPIIEMRSVGNTIVNTVTAVAIAGSFSGVRKLAPVGKAMEMAAGAFGSEGAEKLGGLVTAALFMMFSIGFFYAEIIPNIPYIMWSLAVFSYLSYATAAVIAAGWWGGAMAMQNPNNERTFSGRIHEGMNILLTLFLKPFLMTISFFLATILNIALGYYLQWSLEASAVSSSYGGFNILSLFGMIFVNAIIMGAGVVKNHSLIHELPDQLQRMLSFKTAIDDRSHDQAYQQATQMSGTLGSNIASLGRNMATPKDPASSFSAVKG